MEPAGGEVSFESIRAVREGLGKTTLDDVLKPAVRSVAFIFDDTRVVDAYAFLSSQRIISAPVVSRREYLAWRRGAKMDDMERSLEFQLAGGEPDSSSQQQQQGGEQEGGIDPNSDEFLLRAVEEQRRGGPQDVHEKPLSPSDNPPMRLVLGFLSVMDLLAAVSAELDGIPVANAAEVLEAAQELWRTPIREAFEMATLSTDWESVGAGEGADWSAFWAVRGLGSTQQSLLDILRDGFLTARVADYLSFDKDYAVNHRIAVWRRSDESGEAILANIFSQSDAVMALYEKRELLGSLASAQVASLGLGLVTETDGAVVWRPVVTAPADMSVLECVRHMHRAGVSAVGITDDSGRLVSNFSASDLRSIGADDLDVLLLPVSQFLDNLGKVQYFTHSGLAATGAAQARHAFFSSPAAALRAKREGRSRPGEPGAEEGVAAVGGVDRLDTVEGRAGISTHVVGERAAEDREGLPRSFAFTCRPDETFLQVLERMATRRLHRLYVVTPDYKPVGIITLTDILRLFASDTMEDFIRNLPSSAPWPQQQQEAKKGTEAVEQPKPAQKAQPPAQEAEKASAAPGPEVQRADMQPKKAQERLQPPGEEFKPVIEAPPKDVLPAAAPQAEKPAEKPAGKSLAERGAQPRQQPQQHAHVQTPREQQAEEQREKQGQVPAPTAEFKAPHPPHHPPPQPRAPSEQPQKQQQQHPEKQPAAKVKAEKVDEKAAVEEARRLGTQEGPAPAVGGGGVAKTAAVPAIEQRAKEAEQEVKKLQQAGAEGAAETPAEEKAGAAAALEGGPSAPEGTAVTPEQAKAGGQGATTAAEGTPADAAEAMGLPPKAPGRAAAAPSEAAAPGKEGAGAHGAHHKRRKKHTSPLLWATAQPQAAGGEAGEGGPKPPAPTQQPGAPPPSISPLSWVSLSRFPEGVVAAAARAAEAVGLKESPAEAAAPAAPTQFMGTAASLAAEPGSMPAPAQAASDAAAQASAEATAAAE